MARKRIRTNGDDDGGGLDSLLDTMTNVVGILVLVLIATQLGVQQAVSRAATDIDKLVTTEELEKKREELAITKETKERFQTQLDTRIQDDSKAVETKIASLKRTANDYQQQLNQQKIIANRFAEKIQSDKKAAEEARKKLKDMQDNEENQVKVKAEIAKLLDQEAKLKAQLDETPSQPTLPPKIVSLPNPKPAPQDAKKITLICWNNKVYPIHDEAYRVPIRKQCEAISEGITKNGIVDEEEFFKRVKKIEKNWKDNDCDIEVYRSGIGLNFRFTPKSSSRAGVDERQLLNPRSNFRKSLQLVDNKKYYVNFIVYPDSYEIYLVAREVVSEHGLMAGWEPANFPANDMPVHHNAWLGSNVLFGKRPPVDPNAPKPPPKPKPADEVD